MMRYHSNQNNPLTDKPLKDTLQQSGPWENFLQPKPLLPSPVPTLRRIANARIGDSQPNPERCAEPLMRTVPQKSSRPYQSLPPEQTINRASYPIQTRGRAA